MRWAVLSLALAGCQLVFDLDGEGGASGRCAAGGTFGAGRDVVLDSALSIEAARFDSTRSLAYLSMCTTTDKATCDIHTALVSPETGALGAFSRLGNVNDSDDYDAYPTITDDNRFLLFSSSRDGRVAIYQAATVGGSFESSVVTKLSLVADADATNEPYLAPGAVYYSALDFESSTGSDLYRSAGTPPDVGPGVLVPGPNGEDDEFAPVVSADERELFFASNRQEPDVTLALDIYTATRDAPDATFAEPTRVDAISTPDSIDWPLWISPDGCDLYYIHKQDELATLRVTSRR